mmetsp:Transcript_548/g.1024  ORF Transcript_548/g.1024 Transcript_548/m.1024 type:complete len:346 (-) Transcript_548:20-1057(-)
MSDQGQPTCVEPFESPEIQAACELASFQTVYWSVSVAFLGLSVLALGRLFYEFRVNPAVIRPPMAYFGVIFLADVFFILTFLPSHLYNLSRVVSDDIVDIEDTPWCLVSSWLTNFSIELQFWGVALVAFIPYQITQNAKNVVSRPSNKLQPRLLFFTVGGAFTVSTLWSIVAMSQDHLGSFRGLYCASNSYANENGVFMFVSIFLSLIAMAYFYYYSSVTLLALSRKSEGIDTMIKSAAENIIRTGALMTIALFVTWGPMAVSSLLSVASVELPIGFDMFSGIAAKLKPLIDVIVFFYMPQVILIRRRRRTERTTATLTKFDSFTPVTDLTAISNTEVVVPNENI